MKACLKVLASSIVMLGVLGNVGSAPAAAKSPLITAEEAKLPAFQGHPPLKMRGMVLGPRIVVLAPQAKGENFVSQRPVKLHVRFDTIDGAAVDMRTLKVTYLRLFGIDITDRVKPYVNGDRIDIENAEIPAGEHAIELQIKDVQGRTSDQVLKLVVN
jgi:hypothetical protein